MSVLVDRRLVIAAGAMITAGAGLGLAACSDADGRGLLVWAFLCGAKSITPYSVRIAHVNNRVSPRERLAVASGPLVSYGAGSTLGTARCTAMRAKMMSARRTDPVCSPRRSSK